MGINHKFSTAFMLSSTCDYAELTDFSPLIWSSLTGGRSKEVKERGKTGCQSSWKLNNTLDMSLGGKKKIQTQNQHFMCLRGCLDVYISSSKNIKGLEEWSIRWASCVICFLENSLVSRNCIITRNDVFHNLKPANIMHIFGTREKHY